MTASAPLLALKGVSKRFGAVQALDGVDFEVHAGEVVGLVGDNGAGKSTLVKAISGIYEPDEGEFSFDGEPVSIDGPNAATALGIATVYQDLALCDNLDTVANLFLGREVMASGPSGPIRRLDEAAMEHRSHELLDQLAVSIPSVRSEVGTMSGGQRQQVAVARSLLGEPKVVLLDEPTAALGVAQTAQVLALVKRLRERGLGVVVISHNLADVFEVCDRIFVMRLGQPAGDFAVGDVSQRGGGRRHHRRGRIAARRRCGGPAMSAHLQAQAGRDAAGAGERTGFVRRFVEGDLASLRVVAVLAVIWLIFYSQNERFLSATNLTNLMLQITAVGLISVGVVYVLLVGEIDLSVGAVSGLSAAVMAVLNVKHGVNPYLAIALGVLTGLLIGLVQGALFTRFGIPSFVVTLAGLLAWQGALLYVWAPPGR